MRERKQPTRRRKALRWLALLAFLTAFLTLHGQYYFLPVQAIREAEQLGNIGPTQLIYEFPEREGRTLWGNEKGLMVTTLYSKVYLNGWVADSRAYLDCSGSEPFYAGFCMSGPSERWADWYGRINIPDDAAAVRLDAYKGGILQDTHTILKEDWIEVDGITYFAAEFRWKMLYEGVLYSQLLDEEGNVLYRRELSLEGTRVDPPKVRAVYQ